MRSLLMLALLALAAPALAASPYRLTLPAGTPLEISAVKDVDSGSLESGDIVLFTVTTPAIVQGIALVPKGSAGRGVAVYSRAARVGGRGELMVEVEEVAAADGTWIPIRVRDADTGGLAGLIPEESMSLAEPVFPKGRNGQLPASLVLPVWTTASRDFVVTPGGALPKIAAAPLAPPKSARGTPVKVPEGTVVTIHPKAEISSGNVQTGDTVEFVTSEPVVVDGRTVVAEGAVVKGTVLLARQSGAANKGGELVLGLDRVATVDGKSMDLRLSSAEKGSANRAISFGISRVVPLVGIAVSGRQAVVPVDQEFLVGVARDSLVVVP